MKKSMQRIFLFVLFFCMTSFSLVSFASEAVASPSVPTYSDDLIDSDYSIAPFELNPSDIQPILDFLNTVFPVYPSGFRYMVYGSYKLMWLVNEHLTYYYASSSGQKTYDATWFYENIWGTDRGVTDIWTVGYQAQFRHYNYNTSTGQIQTIDQKLYVNLNGFLYNSYASMASMFQSYISMFNAWFRPNGNDRTQWYWEVFNTDTLEKEASNLAGVLYNISWYLGQMFLADGDASADISGPVDDLNEKFNQIDDAENGIWGSVEGAFNDFVPDLGEVSSLKAIGWVSEFLQKTFNSLGAFAIPITVSLVLGVCMQFIGYFKYKQG